MSKKANQKWREERRTLTRRFLSACGGRQSHEEYNNQSLIFSFLVEVALQS
jgi:hypothetical protein